VSGQVTYGDETFSPTICEDAERVYGMKRGWLRFRGDEAGGLFVMPRSAEAAIMYQSPNGKTQGPDGEIISIDTHCATYELTDSRVHFDCQAQLDRRLRADLRFSSCP